MDWASISRPGTLSVWLSLALGLLPSMAAFCQVAPPRTVSAALAGLRPLAFVVSSRARPEIFARRRVGMIHGEIVRPDGRPACGEKFGRPTSAFRTRGEWNDLGAHENPSHNAIAIRPAKASEIRYAVMPGSLFEVIVVSRPEPDQMRGMTARVRSFQARTLSLEGRPRAGAFARAGKIEKGLGRRRASRRLAASASRRLVRPAAAVRFRNLDSKKPATGFPARAQFSIFCDDEDMPVICPTGQVFFSGIAYARWVTVTPAEGWCRSASSANVEGSTVAPDYRGRKRAVRPAAAQAGPDSAGRHPSARPTGRGGRPRNLNHRRAALPARPRSSRAPAMRWRTTAF